MGKTRLSFLKTQTIPRLELSLITLICEVETIIKSRPLTTALNDPNILEPLKPNHFLLLKTNRSFPPRVFDPSNGVFTKALKASIQFLATAFLSGWLKEYLPTLQLKQK